MLLRPDAVHLDSSGDCTLSGTVQEVVFKGRSTRLELTANGVLLHFDFPSRADLPGVGEHICLQFSAIEALQFFEKTNGKKI